MPDVGNRQTLLITSRDVEVNRELSSPADFVVQRQKCALQRAAITMKAPEAMIRELLNSLLTTSSTPFVPCSPDVSTPPIAPLGSLLSSHASAAGPEGSLPQSCPDHEAT